MGERQLLAGHVVCSRPMKRKEQMHRMKTINMRVLYILLKSFSCCFLTFLLTIQS